jgi:hypothetical protein
MTIWPQLHGTESFILITISINCISPSFTFLPGDINKPKHLKYTNKQNKNQQSWELFIIEDSTLKCGTAKKTFNFVSKDTCSYF